MHLSPGVEQALCVEARGILTENVFDIVNTGAWQKSNPSIHAGEWAGNDTRMHYVTRLRRMDALSSSFLQVLDSSFAFESFAAYTQANTRACVHSSCISNTYSLFVAYIAYTVHLSNWHKYIQWIYTQYRCRKSKSVYGCVMENVKITTRNSPYRYPAAFSPLQTNWRRCSGSLYRAYNTSQCR